MKEDNNTNGAQYWKSLDDLADTPAFKDWVKNEFPAGASELEGVNRRNFMKIMAASFGLAGLGMSGCRRPKQHILPYSKQRYTLKISAPSYESITIKANNNERVLRPINSQQKLDNLIFEPNLIGIRLRSLNAL